MARYYRTASANPLDYMYRINAPLMERVIEANDAAITGNLNQLGQLENAAVTFPFLEADQQRAKQISDTYSKKIDDITAMIKADPANWRKQVDPMRNLTRDIQRDFRTGEVSKIVENYGKYKKTSDYIDEQLKGYNKDGKGISGDRAKAYKQHFLQNFTGTGYNKDTGDYTSINVFDPMGNIDVRKTLSDELDKMKADGLVKITDEITGSGEYFNKTTQKWEGITPEKILRIVTDRLNNPQLMDYLKQDTMVGLISGVFDTNPNSANYGSFINPYSYDKVALTANEQSMINKMQKQIDATKSTATKEAMQSQLDTYKKQLGDRTQLNWNKNSYLAPIMRGIVDQYSYNKTEEGSDLTANSVWTTKFSQQQANNRNNANIASRERMQDKAFENAKVLIDKRLEADKAIKTFEWENKPDPKKPGTGGTGKKGSTKIPDMTKPKTDSNSVVGQFYTTPFFWQTEDKDKMVTSLNDEIMITKRNVDQLTKSLAEMKKTSPDSKVLIANLENQISSTKTRLATQEAQRSNAIDYAISQWKAKGTQQRKSGITRLFGVDNPEDYDENKENMVRSYISGSAKERYDQLNSDFQKLEAQKNTAGNNADPNWVKNSYLPAKRKRDEAYNLYTSGQRIFNNEVKGLANDKLYKGASETTNRNDVIETTDTQDAIIRKLVTMSPSNYKIVGSDGKETNLSFEHGTAPTDPSKFRIKGASSTTGLGDKSVEILANINGKDVIIIPKDDGNKLSGYLSNEFTKSKDAKISNIGRILSNPTSGTIADMLTEMRMNTGTTPGSQDAWVYKTIQNPANPSEVIRVRSRSISTGGGDPKWEFQVETNDENLYYQSQWKNRVPGVTRTSVRGVDYDVDDKGTLKGFVPLISTRSTNGIYHNLEDILSIFPSND